MYTRYAMFYVLHSYRPSFAVVFLILVGVAAARFSTWMALVVVAGYIAFDFLDCVLKVERSRKTARRGDHGVETGQGRFRIRESRELVTHQADGREPNHRHANW